MPTPRRLPLILLPLLIAAGPAASQPAAADRAAERAADKAEDMLKVLQARGANLKAFTADVRMTDENLVMGGSTTRTGHAEYQVKANGDPRLHVVLDKKQFGTKPATDDPKEYLLDDGWLTDRSYHDKNETRRQVSRPGQKTNLFDLGKDGGKSGAFPLPIGQDPAAVHQLFDVKPLPPDQRDPKGPTVALELTPKAGTPLAKQYDAIDVWVDTAQRMPVRVQTFDRGGTKARTVDFDNLAVNPPLNDAVFTLKPVAGMQQSVVPLPDEPPAR